MSWLDSRRYTNQPLITARFRAYKNMHLLYNDISISNKSTPPICSLHSFAIAGQSTLTCLCCFWSHLLMIDIGCNAVWIDDSGTAELSCLRTTAKLELASTVISLAPRPIFFSSFSHFSVQSLKAHSPGARQRTLTSAKGRTSQSITARQRALTSVDMRERTSTSVDARHRTLTDTYNICKCYMLMIFSSVIIYVIDNLYFTIQR